MQGALLIMNKFSRVFVSSLILSVASIQTALFRRFCLSICLACISSVTFAQTQVVTQQLIDQYNLDFSDPQPQLEPYKLVIGSNGALYRRDNSNNSYKKISQRMNGVPAVVETGFQGQTFFQADENFETIVYVSKDPNITPGDSGDSEDVFVYSVSEDKTIRIAGNQPHQGPIREVRINAEGDTVAFGSTDWHFGDISNIETNGVGLDQLNGMSSLIYLSNVVDFSSGASLPVIPKTNAIPAGLDTGDREFISIRFCRLCQFLGDSVIYEWDYVTSFYSKGNLFDYDTKSEVLTELADSFQTEVGHKLNRVETLNDERHMTIKAEFNVFSGSSAAYTTDSFIYDSWLNENVAFSEDFPLIEHNGFNFDDANHKVHDTISTNSRFVTFYARYMEDPESVNDSIGYNSGIIHVYDTWTGELRPAFSVDRTAVSFGEYTNNNFTLGKMTCINCDGIDDYEIEPADIRFHNNDQYITFEANNWYLDPSIAYNSFVVPYTRDVFVVANPFNGDEGRATCGAPDTTVSAGGGVYLWRDCDTGHWHLQVLGSDSAQNLTGKIVADQGINNILAENLEAADHYTGAASKLDFDLDLQAGDEDGFSFFLTDLAGSCIDITNSEPVNVRIGARQIELPVPFDLDTLEAVDSCGDDGSIVVDGAPAIDYATDLGWFIWRENGVWQNWFAAGQYSGVPFIGSLKSTEAMSNLQLISIESGDSVVLTPATDLNFDLHVSGPYRDGFSLAISNSANTCVNLTYHPNVYIFVGPNKVQMPASFDLKTLADCEASPDVETLGKPAIDRAADNGIFLWENSDHNWQAEVVSGAMRRTTVIYVSSQQSLTNIEQVNIETSDVFNILPMSLDLTLHVRPPWYDGFKFVDQAQSNTCVSTTNSDMPIFLGPDRVDVGNSINLSTQASCP